MIMTEIKCDIKDIAEYLIKEHSHYYKDVNETMAKIKRDHWIIEGSLHYVLDVTMGEDNCKIKKGREAMSALRKSAYNIMRLLQRKKENVNKMMTEIMDEIIQDPALGLEYIFKPVILN